MKFKKLGNTDVDVSLICLGTMTWGEQNTKKEAFEQMNYSFERGINFLIQQNYMQYLQNLKHMARQKRL